MITIIICKNTARIQNPASASEAGAIDFWRRSEITAKRRREICLAAISSGLRRTRHDHALVLQRPGGALESGRPEIVENRLAGFANHGTFDAENGTLFGEQTEWNPITHTYRALVGLHQALGRQHRPGDLVRSAHSRHPRRGRASRRASALTPRGDV